MAVPKKKKNNSNLFVKSSFFNKNNSKINIFTNNNKNRTNFKLTDTNKIETLVFSYFKIIKF